MSTSIGQVRGSAKRKRIDFDEPRDSRRAPGWLLRMVVLVTCSPFVGCAWYQSKVAYRQRNTPPTTSRIVHPPKKVADLPGMETADGITLPSVTSTYPPFDPFAESSVESANRPLGPKPIPLTGIPTPPPRPIPIPNPNQESPENAPAEFVLRHAPERLPKPFEEPVRDGSGYFFKVSDVDKKADTRRIVPPSDAIILIDQDKAQPTELQASIGSPMGTPQKTDAVKTPSIPPIEHENDSGGVPENKPTAQMYQAKLKQFQLTGATAQSKKLKQSERNDLFQYQSESSEMGPTKQPQATQWNSKFQLQTVPGKGGSLFTVSP